MAENVDYRNTEYNEDVRLKAAKRRAKVKKMRETMKVKEIARELELTEKRIYQMLQRAEYD